MTTRVEERLGLARSALAEVMRRHALVIIGDGVVQQLLNEATIVAALVDLIQARQR